MLAIAITLPRASYAEAILLEPFWLAGAALSEVLVGATIGLSARLCLAAAEIAGEVVGGSIGLGFAQQVDPSSGHEVAATARVLEMLAVMTFFAGHGHHAVIAALAESLVLVPRGLAKSRSPRAKRRRGPTSTCAVKDMPRSKAPTTSVRGASTLP